MACMDETPKTIVGSEFICFLCGCDPEKERVRIFGKSSVNVQGLIKGAIDVGETVFSDSELFICTRNYYKRLIRFEKISNNLNSLKREIKQDYEKGGVRTRRLRKESTSDSRFAAPDMDQSNVHASVSCFAAKSLKFPSPTTCTSSYGPKPGLAFCGEESDADLSLSISPPPPSLFLTSTPVAKSIAPSKPSSEGAKSTLLRLSIDYPRKTVNKTLEKDYEAMEKALAFGPPQRQPEIRMRPQAMVNSAC